MKSLLSLISYLGSGKYRDRYLGLPIPPTNIQDYHLQTARSFANGLADRLGLEEHSSGTPHSLEPAGDRA